MKTSVTLQEPFSYSLLPIIILSILVVSYGIYLLYSLLRKKENKTIAKNPEQHSISKMELVRIKGKYLAQLEQLRQEAYQKQITTRKTYQNMSSCIRQFVYEVTGIKVQNYTLFDIKQLHMPHLEELIQEFYHPEFAVISQGDSNAAYEKAKRVIELWN